jgi:hypothetical protein
MGTVTTMEYVHMHADYGSLLFEYCTRLDGVSLSFHSMYEFLWRKILHVRNATSSVFCTFSDDITYVHDTWMAGEKHISLVLNYSGTVPKYIYEFNFVHIAVGSAAVLL